MSGTLTGGRKAARTIKRLHGRDFYARIGAMGGKKGTTGGFAAYTTCRCPAFESVHHTAMCAGKRGGLVSRRRSKANGRSINA